MRISLLTAAVALLGCATAPTVCGCYAEECQDTNTCVPEPAPVCIADPSTGPADEACGVFVSSTLGDDANPGTRDQPVRTITTAIALAQAGSMRVYACAEVFGEVVEVPAGVELWGGLDCANDWIYIGSATKTTIAPGPGAVPLRFTEGAGTAVAADIRAEAAGAIEPSGSSIAALVLPDAAVEILRSELVAGDGAAGANGADGGNGPAFSGTPGWAGGAACSAEVVPGGPQVETICDDKQSIGGKGGDGYATQGGDGQNGQPEPVPNSMDWGEGGTGENGIQCIEGAGGLNGEDGMHGLGATGAGRLTPAGWEGGNGQDGGNGRPGQGGGGGGGSRGGSLYCGPSPEGAKGGASGGSGGGGACGGKGGKGGGHGGASIGLLTLSSEVTVRSTTIMTSRGGDGGNGGFAQPGGVGGPGGSGGIAFGMALSGCQGGPGGDGGHGGYGGGGLGGHSIGIVYPVAQPPAQEDVVVSTGAAGKGGEGGNPAITGGAGEGGIAAIAVGFPP